MTSDGMYRHVYDKHSYLHSPSTLYLACLTHTLEKHMLDARLWSRSVAQFFKKLKWACGFPGFLNALCCLTLTTHSWTWIYQLQSCKGETEWIYERMNIVMWAPTCWPWTSLCLHRANPIEVYFFKPIAWESFWKEHWDPLWWKGHCLGCWSSLHRAEKGGSILRRRG